MSVIVQGMEMPKCCAECDFELHDEYECIYECPLIYKGYTNKTRMFARLDDCPLIEIPKDAKLVDANELLDKSEWYGEKATYDNPMPNGEEAVPVECINDAVIINTERNRKDDNRRSD